jgi:secreted Zn-dependent insulinase-like peptidase
LNLPEEEFKKQVAVLITKTEEKDKKLEEHSSRLFSEIKTHNYQFDRVQREVEMLQKVTQAELQQFFDTFIFNKTTRAKLSLQQFSKNKPVPAPTPGPENQILVENIQKFKRFMPLYPVCN